MLMVQPTKRFTGFETLTLTSSITTLRFSNYTVLGFGIKCSFPILLAAK